MRVSPRSPGGRARPDAAPAWGWCLVVGGGLIALAALGAGLVEAWIFLATDYAGLGGDLVWIGGVAVVGVAALLVGVALLRSRRRGGDSPGPVEDSGRVE